KTKILFGGGYIPNYEPFMAHFFLDQFDPRAVKWQDETLQSRYVLTTKRSTTRNRSGSATTSVSYPHVETETEAEANSVILTNGTVDGVGAGVVQVEGAVEGVTLLPDGQLVNSIQEVSSGGTNEMAS